MNESKLLHLNFKFKNAEKIKRIRRLVGRTLLAKTARSKPVNTLAAGLISDKHQSTRSIKLDILDDSLGRNTDVCYFSPCPYKAANITCL